MSREYLSDYAYLAEASYTDFSKTDNDNFNLTHEENSNKPESFANLVTENYIVKAHWKDEVSDSLNPIHMGKPASGFSGTLFKRKGKYGANSEYVFALKGSLGSKDLGIADAANIVHDGLAHHQIIDMYNFWKSITETGEYKVATMKTDYTLTAAYSVAAALPVGGGALKEFIEHNLKGKGYFIDSGEVVRIVKEESSHTVYDANDSRRNGLSIPR